MQSQKTNKIKSFKIWLYEEYGIFKNEDEWYDYAETINELKDEMESEICHEMLVATPDSRISWRVINANRAKKIWKDYGELNIIRDKKGIDEIKQILLENTIKLNICNSLQGHDTYYIFDEWRDKFEITDEEYEKIKNISRDEDGDYYYYFTYKNHQLISDFGLPKLEAWLPALYKATDEIEILRIADNMLSIVHPRNDLSAFFIEGGSQTLSQMSGYDRDE